MNSEKSSTECQIKFDELTKAINELRRNSAYRYGRLKQARLIINKLRTHVVDTEFDEVINIWLSKDD